MELLVDRLGAARIEVHPGDGELASARPDDVVGWFIDPFGIRHELVRGLRQGTAFRPGRELGGPFVTGEQGLGHIVLFVPDLERGHHFFQDVLGLVVSDDIESGPMHVRFYHCPGRAARHHTVALTAIPARVGLHHLMLEVAEIDDVGRALDLVKKRGIPVQMDLGRHPNDLMTSFYVRTPSGFDIEYGTGGVVVDDATWETMTTMWDVTATMRPQPAELVGQRAKECSDQATFITGASLIIIDGGRYQGLL